MIKEDILQVVARMPGAGYIFYNTETMLCPWAPKCPPQLPSSLFLGFLNFHVVGQLGASVMALPSRYSRLCSSATPSPHSDLLAQGKKELTILTFKTDCLGNRLIKKLTLLNYFGSFLEILANLGIFPLV
jgi:hypothetical protein